MDRVPEGDTIHLAAARIRDALAGRVPDEIRTPHPRHRGERWPERLAGRAVVAVDARGKHLFLHFAGGLVLLYFTTRSLLGEFLASFGAWLLSG